MVQVRVTPVSEPTSSSPNILQRSCEFKSYEKTYPTILWHDVGLDSEYDGSDRGDFQLGDVLDRKKEILVEKEKESTKGTQLPNPKCSYRCSKGIKAKQCARKYSKLHAESLLIHLPVFPWQKSCIYQRGNHMDTYSKHSHMPKEDGIEFFKVIKQIAFIFNFIWYSTWYKELQIEDITQLSW